MFFAFAVGYVIGVRNPSFPLISVIRSKTFDPARTLALDRGSLVEIEQV